MSNNIISRNNNNNVVFEDIEQYIHPSFGYNREHCILIRHKTHVGVYLIFWTSPVPVGLFDT